MPKFFAKNDLDHIRFVRSQKQSIRQERQRGREASGRAQMSAAALKRERRRSNLTQAGTGAAALGAAYALGRRRPYTGFTAMAGMGAGLSANSNQRRRIRRMRQKRDTYRDRAVMHNDEVTSMQSELDTIQTPRKFEKSLVSKRRNVPSPLAQIAAAGMIKQGLSGLGFAGSGGAGGVPRSMIAGGLAGPYDVLVTRLKRKGLAHDQAKAAALRIIYAQNLAGRMI